MQTRVWPLGREGSAELFEHEADECVFCVVARRVEWVREGDVIYLTDGTRVQRVQYLGRAAGVGGVLCDGTTLEQAEAEIRAGAELAAGARVEHRAKWRSPSKKGRRRQ